VFPCLPVSLSFSLSVGFSVALSLPSLCMSLSLSVTPTSPSPSQYIYLPFSLRRFMTFCLNLSFLCVSLYLSSLSLCLSASYTFSVYHCLTLPLSLSLSLISHVFFLKSFFPFTSINFKSTLSFSLYLSSTHSFAMHSLSYNPEFEFTKKLRSFFLLKEKTSLYNHKRGEFITRETFTKTLSTLTLHD
jgi:hypothetical protein